MTKMVMGRSRVFLGPSKAENSAYSVHRVKGNDPEIGSNVSICKEIVKD